MRKRNLFFALVLVLALSALVLSGCGKSYTVTFDPNGGELVSGELTQKVAEGESAAAPEVKNGDKVLTWEGDYSNITADTTVTASWKGWYDVTFELNGGELVSGELTQRVLEGEDAVLPEATNGKRELSWKGDYTNITADTVIEAEWTKVAMNTVELAKYVQERTVTVNVKELTGSEGTGSGFFIDDQGTILTNFHVIDLAEEITVEVQGGGSYPVRQIIDFSNLYDLAVLKIDMNDTPYLDFAEEEVRTGEQVYAVGSALGTLTGTFSDGIVSATSRAYGMIDCIQMTTPISPGNSGGPLVNEYGEVVGVNTASYVNGENLNLAIKPSTLDKLTMDKNWTVREFKEWYEMEATRCWSPMYNGSYFYSLVNNYQQVTGATCLFSCENEEDGAVVEGYHDMYDFYVYEYKASEYDAYTAYLRSVGFEYQGSEHQSTWTGTSYYYYNEKDEISLDLYILDDNTQIWIWPELA